MITIKIKNSIFIDLAVFPNIGEQRNFHGRHSGPHAACLSSRAAHSDLTMNAVRAWYNASTMIIIEVTCMVASNARGIVLMY